MTRVARRGKDREWIGDIRLHMELRKCKGPHEAPFQWDWQIVERLEDGYTRVRVYGAIPVYPTMDRDDTMEPDFAGAIAVIADSIERKK